MEANRIESWLVDPEPNGSVCLQGAGGEVVTDNTSDWSDSIRLIQQFILRGTVRYGILSTESPPLINIDVAHSDQQNPNYLGEFGRLHSNLGLMTCFDVCF
jgi:hypothetical protein